ncbi:hypothetical protein PIB30_044393 [Stylosanthes scabra]|uniref:Ubiquitin-like protease family profile domain-containing protein n=1 Tax=Stylosanthes scabra TaxID=79078 RepID=A0ABU6XDY1_9FABA|nr:hypothetical protein [Stylosanthes scabra]
MVTCSMNRNEYAGLKLSFRFNSLALQPKPSTTPLPPRPILTPIRLPPPSRLRKAVPYHRLNLTGDDDGTERGGKSPPICLYVSDTYSDSADPAADGRAFEATPDEGTTTPPTLGGRVDKLEANRPLTSSKEKWTAWNRGKSGYIISNEIPIRLYPELHQNFLQVRHVDNYSKWAKEIGTFVPHNMTLTFYPTLDMHIEGIDLYAAAFIFNEHLDQGEVLVKTMGRSLTRGMLRCLEPGKQVHDDVMDLLGAMLTVHSSRVQWFLPSVFAQIGTGRGEIPVDTLNIIKEQYMGRANRVLKSDGHWFLLLIDTPRRELIYLDSLASEEMKAKRRRDIKKTAVFLEEMVDHDDWYNNPKQGRLLCSDYQIVQPKVLHQSKYSNDCGMYLAQWMILYRMGGSYNVERITEYSRMRLAVDMVLKHHNDLRPQVIEDALQHWRAYVKHSEEQD